MVYQGASAGQWVRRREEVSGRQVLVVGLTLRNKEGASVATANPTRHYAVMQSGSKGGEKWRVAEEMKPGSSPEFAESREESN